MIARGREWRRLARILGWREFNTVAFGEDCLRTNAKSYTRECERSSENGRYAGGRISRNLECNKTIFPILLKRKPPENGTQPSRFSFSLSARKDVTGATYAYLFIDG
jgi:hypothetical protein